MSQDSVCISVYDGDGTNMNRWITALALHYLNAWNRLPAIGRFFLMSGADPGIFLSGGLGCLVVAIGEVLLQEPIHPHNLFMY